MPRASRCFAAARGRRRSSRRRSGCRADRSGRRDRLRPPRPRPAAAGGVRRPVAAHPAGAGLMAQQRVNAVNLYDEDRGDGAPIVLIQGCGGSGLGFADAVTELAKLGRVTPTIGVAAPGASAPSLMSERASPSTPTTRRRCSTRSRRPRRSSAAATGERSRPISPSAIPTECEQQSCSSPTRCELAPKAAEWINALAERPRETAARDGTDAVGQALITAVSGQDAWRSFPDQWQRVLTQNGPAILPELAGEWVAGGRHGGTRQHHPPDAARCRSRSPPEFHEPINVYAEALPKASPNTSPATTSSMRRRRR